MSTGSSEDAYRPPLGTTRSYQAVSTNQTPQACSGNSTKQENIFFSHLFIDAQKLRLLASPPKRYSLVCLGIHQSAGDGAPRLSPAIAS